VRRLALTLLATGLAVGGAACSNDEKAADATPTSVASPDSTPRRGELPAVEERYETFDATEFDASSAEVTNRYYPLRPGTRLVFEGADKRGKGRERHRIEFVVTDLVQEIDGVAATVIWERDFVRDVLEEAELAYFAQDTSGNVWHLGEYSELYEDGSLLGASGFLQGHLADARAGIMMPADPRTGTPSFSEGYGPPPIDWTDRGRVVATGRQTRVPAGEFDDVVVIEEYSEDELTAFQVKHYAPDVGNVRVGWAGEDESQEVLLLVRIDTLDAAAMDRVRTEAGALEARARMHGSPPPSRVRGA
jgi:hypothetical protein